MEYLEFCNKVKRELIAIVDDSCTVRLEEVVKTNDIIRQAVVISEKGTNISPSIYLENYYADHINGRHLMDICHDIINLHKQSTGKIAFNHEEYLDYESIREKIYVKVINFNKNKRLLSKIPYRKHFDLAMIAYILLEDGVEGRATINVQNKNLELWNIDEERLFSDGVNNTLNTMKPKIQRISEVMRDLLKERYEECEDGMDISIDELLESSGISNASEMYILSSENKVNGAVYIVLNDIIMDFSNQLDTDFYVLPSSIHEAILISMDSGVSKDELLKMVKDINETEVDPLEVLSDTVYEFYRDKGILWQ